MNSLICSLLLLLVGTNAQAQEVDSFTDRPFMIERLRDATDLSDRFVNDLIAEVVQKLNDRKSRKALGPDAEDAIVASVFQSPISPELFSPVEDWIKSAARVQRYRLSFRGVYGGAVDYDDMYMAWYVGLSPTIRLAGVLMGLDKISHFFGQGWQYFERNRVLAREQKALSEGDRFDLVRKFGHDLEERHLGLMNDGVYSYGDMASNWQGFLFYQRLIGSGRNAHIIRSEGGRYALGTPFTFRDYVTDEFDEVLNPNRLRTERFYLKVAVNFHQQSPSGNRSVCGDYLADRGRYLNRTGRSMERVDYTWSGDPGAKPKAPLVLRIEEICARDVLPGPIQRSSASEKSASLATSRITRLFTVRDLPMPDWPTSKVVLPSRYGRSGSTSNLADIGMTG